MEDTTEVCLEIVSGVFVPGGYVTVSLTTSPLTATGELRKRLMYTAIFFLPTLESNQCSEVFISVVYSGI